MSTNVQTFFKTALTKPHSVVPASKYPPSGGSKSKLNNFESINKNLWKCTTIHICVVMKSQANIVDT